jgi:hypothetical protein
MLYEPPEGSNAHSEAGLDRPACSFWTGQRSILGNDDDMPSKFVVAGFKTVAMTDFWNPTGVAVARPMSMAIVISRVS